jgi:hypothetical protein
VIDGAGAGAPPRGFLRWLADPFLRLRAGDDSVRMEHGKTLWAHGLCPSADEECAWL